MHIRLITAATLALLSHHASAKECWALTEVRGQIAFSDEKYAFQADKYSNPMVLCFNDEKTGTVSGDDTSFTRFGVSTLIGWAQNKDIELVETYQIDRVRGQVLFTKTRIGTASVIPGGPDLVGSFAGKATRIKE